MTFTLAQCQRTEKRLLTINENFPSLVSNHFTLKTQDVAKCPPWVFGVQKKMCGRNMVIVRGVRGRIGTVNTITQ